MVADEGITFETGDILFIRSGFIAAYEKLNAEERAALPMKKTYIGVESCLESAEWLWEHQFAAVAGDMPGFEQTTIWGSEVQLHQWVLAGWGTPIGELFYLEDLARACKKLKRNTFFLTSMPLRVSQPHPQSNC
jgi:kynurenine formamidase